MKQLNLCGQWKLSGGEFREVKANVPGCVHTDLLAAGLVPDPYYRDSELSLMWIGETDWEYSRTFEVTADLLAEETILLRCEGLDTFASIRINERKIARTDNMFRTWNFDVKKFLLPGENSISILFESTFPYIEKKNDERKLGRLGRAYMIAGGNWVRKMQCNYGWDWGPKCVTAGIWRNIEIIAFSSARINDVLVEQTHRAKAVVLTAKIQLEKLGEEELTLETELRHADAVVAKTEISTRRENENISLTITEPRLWWPNNLGKQELYEVVITLSGKNGVLDCIKKKIGLRTLRLDRHADLWGESFQFVVNGVPFFAKGANWIPADTFVTRAHEGFYKQLIQDAADANMNFLRVWGGGIYEQDIFYELCDTYGICVWQDFMFACNAYPAFDRAFMENVRQEAIDNVKRLRHHACLALWCGNNELEQMRSCVNDDVSNGAMSWEEYKSMFDQLLPEVVHEYAPGMDYWPSSPHTPGANRLDYNNPTAGDAHLWEVWHGRKPFEWYRTCDHRFNSEFGFQSFPEPRVVEFYTVPKDRNVSSYIMEHHQRSPIGNDAIIQYMLAWFRLPESFDQILITSQILQGVAIKYAVEHWRRSMPRGMGTLYWQLNDCWPVASWSSIDYLGNWKALQYMAKKFFQPLLVSCVEDATRGQIEIHLTNDKLARVSGVIRWQLYTLKGELLERGDFAVDIEANRSELKSTLDFANSIKLHSPRDLLFFVSFTSECGCVSENLSMFSRPKHMELLQPDYKMQLEQNSGQRFTLALTPDVPALWVRVDVEGRAARYSDLYFHIKPGEKKVIEIRPEEDMTLEELKSRLRIFSL